MTWPTPATDYQFNPWTDPNGIQWIYDASIPAWARYRVAGGGTALTSYVSQVASLADYPAILETPQAAATASIRKIGTGATDAAAGNDSRLSNSRTPTAHKSSHASGGSDALSPSDIGAIPATGGTMTNGTIGGTLTFNSTTITFGTGAAAAMQTAMGIGCAYINPTLAANVAIAAGWNPVNVASFTNIWNDGNMDATTRIYTVPVSGLYECTGLITATTLPDGALLAAAVYVNGAIAGLLGRGTIRSASGTTIGGFGGSVKLALTAGQTVQFYCLLVGASGDQYLLAPGYTHFSIQRIR